MLESLLGRPGSLPPAVRRLSVEPDVLGMSSLGFVWHCGFPHMSLDTYCDPFPGFQLRLSHLRNHMSQLISLIMWKDWTLLFYFQALRKGDSADVIKFRLLMGFFVVF